MSTPRALRAAALLALLAATLLVHAPENDAEFVYDDAEFVVANQSIRSPAGALAALLLPFPPEQPERGLYRPLTNLSYAFDYAVWEEQPLGYHATNVALYAATVVLVAVYAGALTGSAGFGFTVGLLFAVHPVHCEAVDSVAGRSEILSLLLSLVSLLLFLRAVQSPGRPGAALAGSAVAYALACLFKESGAVLLGVLVAHALFLEPPVPLRSARAWLARLHPLRAHAVLLLGYLVLRSAVLGRFSPDASILRDEGLATRLYTIASVFLMDLKLLLWPYLEVDYFYQAAIPIPRRLTLAALLGGVLLLGALAGALALALRHFTASPGEEPARWRERAAALCALAFFFGSWLPTSHVFDLGALVAERFLFAPSVGFLALAGLAARRALERALAPAVWRAALFVLVATVALVWGVRSHARAAEWRDGVKLWTAASRSLPSDVRVQVNLASAHLDRGELAPARAALGRALAIDPGHPAVLGSLAVLALAEGRLDEAEAGYRRLVERDPADFRSWYNLGLVEARRGNHAEAAEHFRRSLSLNPNFNLARRGLGASERALREAKRTPAQGAR